MHLFGRTSIIGFLCGVSVIIIPFDQGENLQSSLLFFLFSCVLHWLTCQLISLFNLYKRRRRSWRIESHVILRSYLLGLGFTLGQLLIWKDLDVKFGTYLSILSFFHYSEFLVTSIISPSTLCLDSFLLNHSQEYGIAAVASWLEYALELYTVPWLKAWQWPMKIGLFFCIAGELLRKGAMFTAWSNFTHLVREKRTLGHKLVTHGLYSFCRHPSYAGWFWWSIGTQLVLVNPICTVAYAVASWKFFSSRIFYEEATLLSFFGHKYFQYQDQVKHTGVPFVPGYILQSQLDQQQQQKQNQESPKEDETSPLKTQGLDHHDDHDDDDVERWDDCGVHNRNQSSRPCEDDGVKTSSN